MAALRKSSPVEAERRRLRRKQVKAKVRSALKSGKLRKSCCTVCYSMEVEAHHADYTKPLDVEWLCKEHHLQRHRDLREECPEFWNW